MYLDCKSNSTLGGSLCGGRAIIDLEKDVLKVTKGHDHPSDDDEKIIREFMVQCKISSEACVAGNLREVYDVIAQEFPLAAQLVPFASVECQMGKWRRARFPKNPRTTGETISCLEKLSGNSISNFGVINGNSRPTRQFLR